MFTCQACRKSVGPKVSPIIAVETRPKSYTVKREIELIGEIEDIVMGSEITREFRLCAECAGVAVPQGEPTLTAADRESIFGKVAGFQSHARNCQGSKPIKDADGKKISETPCHICKKSAEFFGSLSDTILNEVLSDRPAVEAKFRVVTLAAEAMFERTKHKSKRAGADFLSAFAVLKPYAQLVGAIESEELV